MKSIARAAAALLLSASLAPSVLAQAPQGTAAVLATERDRVSYMVGMDVGATLRQAGPGLDLAAFERAMREALAGGEPPVDEATAQAALAALAARNPARDGTPPGAAAPPPLDWDVLSVVFGYSVGASLAPIADEIEVPVVLQAVGTVVQGGQPLLGESEYTQVREAFSQRMQAEAEAQARALSAKNLAEGDAFLSANKAKKGVFTTGSGLQYMVLRPGAGERPSMTDTVRVHYAGTLLDGTTFDSSYARGEPVEFRLDQVIPGWTEGVALMPVGAKYRFWIPADLAYGATGTPGGPIGPHATLVFDVELLAIP